MTSSMLRRQLKNLVQNYSEAEVKVREATSNDPWGPSSSQMADISDLTYNVVACNEIMTMLWKRLKDDKNWRHIHKSLTLLEYLLKTGDDRVLLKMKDNIYIVKALTEYRFVEKDGKDQGVNVREKAKVVLVLMEDDDKLKEERDLARKTREKTSKSSAASSSETVKDPNYKPCYVPGATGLPSLDNIPSVADLTASFAARKEERLRQEAEKKEADRRAKMSEDELKWEDAGKGNGVTDSVWGGEPEEEDVKPDPWGEPKEPREATDSWGTPSRPDTTETADSSDPWQGASKTDDPFVAPKTDEDPFATPKNEEDPFFAPKDEIDPFKASQDDPFNTPKDSSDPFSAPKDKEDPFSAPKDKPDPFSSSTNDPFNTPKDDPFSTSKNDPFSTPKDDPFFAPKDDPFNNPKNDPFNTPKDDPFNTSKEDPFAAPASTPPKEDPFAVPVSTKDDPFTAPRSPSKNDPFSASTKPTRDDPFAAPTSPKDDPFSAPTKDDPFTAPTTPPKNETFAVLSSPPKDISDPFSAPPVSSPQGSADAWEAPPLLHPLMGQIPGRQQQLQRKQRVEIPGGMGQALPHLLITQIHLGIHPNWTLTHGEHQLQLVRMTCGVHLLHPQTPPHAVTPLEMERLKPVIPGVLRALQQAMAQKTPFRVELDLYLIAGKQTAQEEMYRKAASFLGSTGASLVDLDDLFSSNPKPKQHPLTSAPTVQAQAIGKDRKQRLTLDENCIFTKASLGIICYAFE
ncbi:hypothetical protein Q5P01_018764 [Channa striata]|uniref:ENTH domain-containing protein n=1 Tax=Channa striata TaxID=64152 RepID=A0AA88M8E4_CHASR|nr:hypothetical protein Q5P01_018764 [Channa striata]